MDTLAPVSIDIETRGLEPGAVITVVGLGFELGERLVLNTGGRRADADRLEADLERRSGSTVQVMLVKNEVAVLNALADLTAEYVDVDRHYLVGHNAEKWRGGFDLPFLRTACARHDCEWPLPSIAYADTVDMMSAFYTDDTLDLEGVYDILCGAEHCDPFDESQSAVAAHDAGDWADLLAHNLADIRRTRELAVLAGQYVPKSSFRMRNLTPPDG